MTNTFATWNLVIASHAIAAALALVLAPVQLIRRHYGDPTHRLIGRVWAVQMLFTSAISFLIGGWADVSDWILRGLAVITLVGVTLGIRHARAGRINAHPRAMVLSYAGLIGAFVGVLVVPERRVPTAFREQPLVMLGISLAIVAVALLFAVGAGRLTAKAPGSQTAG